MIRVFIPALLAFMPLSLFLSGCSHAPGVINEGRSEYFGSSKVSRYRLSNGLKILILEDHSAPTFAYQTWFHVGSVDEQKGLTGLAHFFEHLMFKQTKNHKDGEFDKLLETAGVEGENASTSHDFTDYVQSLPSNRLNLIASLESDRMVNLLVIDESMNSEREVVQNERRFRNENNPDGQLYERLYELAYQKHSYHWPVIGYDVDLRNAKRKDFEAFYKRFYAPNNATVVIVGDVSPDKAADVIEKYYGKLQPSKINRPTPPREPEQTAQRIETQPVKIAVEKVMIGYHIPDVNSLDFPAIEVLRNILGTGKSSRLYRRLVDGGIATGVDLETVEHSDPGLLLFFVNMQKGRTAKQALPLIDSEIKSLMSGKIAQEEIDRAVSMHRFAFFDGLAGNQSKAQFLGFYETVAGRFERGVDIVNALRSVDKAAVVRVARKYLRKENRSIVIGTPARSIQER